MRTVPLLARWLKKSPAHWHRGPAEANLPPGRWKALDWARYSALASIPKQGVWWRLWWVEDRAWRGYIPHVQKVNTPLLFYWTSRSASCFLFRSATDLSSIAKCFISR